MKSGNFEVSLLVENKPIQEYPHEDRTFVEGRNGSEYKIRINNKSYSRTCFVISVDGLSVLDGKECGKDSPGYILKPWETLDIACYKVDDKTGAKFVFGEKDKSYSSAIGKGTDNVGVIGARVFREKDKPIHVQRVPRGMPCSTTPFLASGSSGWWSGNIGSAGIGASASMSGGMSSSCNATIYTNTVVTPDAEAAVMDSAPVEQQLGTVFGEAMQWQTQVIAFEREAAPSASFEIFYDSRKNLERRGIKFEQKVPPLPNAFPADTGCPVPDNWRK